MIVMSDRLSKKNKGNIKSRNKILEQTYDKIYDICKKYKKEYKKKMLKKLLNEDNGLKYDDIIDDLLLALAFKQYHKNVQFQQKRDKCEIGDNNNISTSRKLKSVMYKLEKSNADGLKLKRIRKDVTKPDLNEFRLTDATGILKPKYIKTNKKLNEKKNEIVGKLKNIQKELIELIQKLKNVNEHMKITFSRTETKMTEIPKDDVKTLLQQKKDFRHILERYREKIKNIYSQLQKYNSRYKLDQETQLNKTKDSDMYKKLILLMKNLQREFELKRQERVKKIIKIPNNDERAKLPNYKNLDAKITNLNQYDFDSQIEMAKQTKILQKKIAEWKMLYDKNMTEREKIKLELKALAEKLTEYKNRHMMKNILEMKKSNDQYTEKKNASSESGNILKEIVSENGFEDLKKDCSISSSHEYPRNHNTKLKNENQITTIINQDLIAKLIKTMALLKIKSEQNNKNSKKDSTFLDLWENFDHGKIEVIKENTTKSKSIVAEEQIQTKGKETNDKTKVGKQNDLSKLELIFWDPYCGLQNSFSVQDIVENFIINKAFNSKPFNNPSKIQENLNIILATERLRIKINKEHDKIKIDERNEFLDPISSNSCFGPYYKTTI